VKRFVLVLMLLAGVVAVFGCAPVRDDDVARPWTEPEPWERHPGIGPFAPE